MSRIRLGDDLKDYLKKKDESEKITCRQYADTRDCESCGYATFTFYCLGKFSIHNANCAQCFVDGLIRCKARVI